MVILSVLFLSAHQGFAEEAAAHEHETSIKIPATVDGIWKEIKKHQTELDAVVKGKKLSEVHAHAFAIRDLSKPLPSKVHEDHKKHVENLVKQIAQIAEDLDKSGDAGNQAATEAGVKKLNTALKTLEEHTL